MNKVTGQIPNKRHNLKGQMPSRSWGPWAPKLAESYHMMSSLQGISWANHKTAGGDDIATQVFKNNVAKVRYHQIHFVLDCIVFVFVF